MAKVSLVISIVVLLAAIGFGFVVKDKAKQKVAELETMTLKHAASEKSLAESRADNKAKTEEIAAGQKTIDEQKTQIADITEKEKKASEDAKKAEAEAAEQKTLLASVQKDFDEMKAKMAAAVPGVGADAGNNAVAAVQLQLDNAKKEIEEAKVMADNYKARQTAAEETNLALQKRIKQYEDRVQVTSLTGRIVDVNPGWNFVVLDVGDKEGVTVNSPLLVVRNGQRVANLKITSVEPRTSIADVVPGTVAKGITVQRGDRVVFAGNRGQPPLPPLGNTGGATGAGSVPPANSPTLPQ